MINFLKKSQAFFYDLVDWFRCLITTLFFNRSLQSSIDSNIRQSIDKAGEKADNILDTVKDRGFYILPSVISTELISKMRVEFRAIIDQRREDFFAVDEHEGSVCVRMKPFFTLSNLLDFPTIYAFYNSGIFRAMTKQYYQADNLDSEYITEIFVHETPETNDPLSGTLHWDRAQTLKFWVYLDDVPESAGPMLVEENSTERNRKLRIKMYSEKTNLVGGVDNVLGQTTNNIVPMSAPAGSILIHNTDASHGASNVETGMVRQIIRGHCRARNLSGSR